MPSQRQDSESPFDFFLTGPNRDSQNFVITVSHVTASTAQYPKPNSHSNIHYTNQRPSKHPLQHITHIHSPRELTGNPNPMRNPAPPLSPHISQLSPPPSRLSGNDNSTARVPAKQDPLALSYLFKSSLTSILQNDYNSCMNIQAPSTDLGHPFQGVRLTKQAHPTCHDLKTPGGPCSPFPSRYFLPSSLRTFLFSRHYDFCAKQPTNPLPRTEPCLFNHPRDVLSFAPIAGSSSAATRRHALTAASPIPGPVSAPASIFRT